MPYIPSPAIQQNMFSLVHGSLNGRNLFNLRKEEENDRSSKSICVHVYRSITHRPVASDTDHCRCRLGGFCRYNPHFVEPPTGSPIVSAASAFLEPPTAPESRVKAIPFCSPSIFSLARSRELVTLRLVALANWMYSWGRPLQVSENLRTTHKGCKG